MRDERIRVLHVITRLDRGGSAENTLLTAAHLDGERFATSVVVGPTEGARSPTEELARRRGVEFIHLPDLVRPIHPTKDLKALVKLWRLIRRGRYQIVHTHTSKGGLLGRLAARLAGTPVVVHTPHGHVFYGYYGPFATRLFIWLEKIANLLADRVVALTEREVEEYIAFGVGRTGKFSVIHSGVDFAPFDRETATCAEVRRELGLPVDAVVVGTSGRLTAIKGQADLVEAIGLLHQERIDLHLLLVGDGEEREVLEAQVERLEIADQVIFAGWRQDVSRVLRAMDIFAFPSHNEGMGKALVEAMYAGLPVVASSVGGIPELVVPGRHGLLVEAGRPGQLAAALAEMAKEEQQRREWGRAGRERASGYGIGKMIEEIEGLYEELLEEKMGSGGLV